MDLTERSDLFAPFITELRTRFRMDAKMLQHVQTFHGKTRMRLGYAYSATTGDEGEDGLLSTENKNRTTSCSGGAAGPLDESSAARGPEHDLSTDPALLWEQERIGRSYSSPTLPVGFMHECPVDADVRLVGLSVFGTLPTKMVVPRPSGLSFDKTSSSTIPPLPDSAPPPPNFSERWMYVEHVLFKTLDPDPNWAAPFVDALGQEFSERADAGPDRPFEPMLTVCRELYGPPLAVRRIWYRQMLDGEGSRGRRRCSSSLQDLVSSVRKGGGVFLQKLSCQCRSRWRRSNMEEEHGRRREKVE